ncbi:molybdopterin-dependent oxidoreductase [Denitrobaculum tricleocarpae]|uniref:Molybdopterin-dependent oxidoreductase n=1 Tax=Denitrobaculum tricleocarpae TaxID=2591009 RepID=A0A545TPS6_9PROT|nr:molybdopterin-dependent oxidoreductase [Denitrobaculum tricleocarpae]TQV79188.1 molybdopterin-dependent oxidoreductase [Denitrobaculum tricleocarpae]
MTTSRREFLASVSATAMFLAAPKVFAASAGAGRNVTFIPHAGQAGVFWAVKKDGEFIKAIPRTEFDPRPTKMITDGLVSRTYHQTRVKYPYVRKSYLENLDGDRKPELRGKEPFVRVDWETALNLTSKAILDTIDSHGNDGIFSSSYGAWAHGGVLTPNVLQGRFFNLIGGMSVTVSDYSGGAGQVIMPHVVGDMEVYSRQTSWWQILQNTELFVLIGTDPHKNGRAEGRTTDHSMYPRWEVIRDSGVKFLSINPQYTTTDEWLKAEWMKIIPNTDTALFLAMSQHVHAKGMHDQEFLERYTVGADKFIAYLNGQDDGTVKTPAWASKITGIPEADIIALAEECAVKRTQFAGSWAIQRAHHGEMPYWAITSFAAMTGQIGLPGGGIGFSWHWGQGGALFAQARAPGGLPQGRNQVVGFCPASRITEMLKNPGGKFIRNGGEYSYPDAQMIFNSGNNFLSHHQNTNELIEAMQKCHSVVCIDPWWVASARFADIVLPATSTVERDEISSGGTYSKDKVYAMRQVIDPVGESLDDFEIFRRLAEIFNVEQQFTDGLDRIDIIQASYEKSSAAETMDFEEFWERGVARVPIPTEELEWVRHGAFREDPDANPLHTRSGKVELYCEAIAEMNVPDCPPMAQWLEPAEYLGNAEPGQVHVVSPHPYNRIHSQFAQSDLRHELNVEDREFVRINTEDAAARGIKDGDLVELSNERGTTIAGARVTDQIMPGVVSLYEGAWLSFDSKGRCNSGSINVLTSSRASSQLSQATAANTCIATLKKAVDVEGPNQAYVEPDLISDQVASLDPDSLGIDRAANIAESFMSAMEPGERLFYEKCTLCHIPQDPKSHTKAQWKGITESMFPNAGVEGEDQKLILDFLYQNARDAG